MGHSSPVECDCALQGSENRRLWRTTVSLIAWRILHRSCSQFDLIGAFGLAFSSSGMSEGSLLLMILTG